MNTWNDDSIQFPRLLAEIQAMGLTEAQYSRLSSEMGLEMARIDELFDRADAAWEAIKMQTGLGRKYSA